MLSALYFPAEDFAPHANADDMHAYRWNDEVVDHLFCKTCGIYPYHGNTEYGYRVNLGCVDDIDLAALTIGEIDGRSLPVRDAAKPDGLGT